MLKFYKGKLKMLGKACCSIFRVKLGSKTCTQLQIQILIKSGKFNTVNRKYMLDATFLSCRLPRQQLETRVAPGLRWLMFKREQWQLIRDSSKNSGCNIEEKADEEMILYANSFIQTIISQLKNQETKEVKEFLSNLIEENQFEATLDSNLQMWGGESFVLRAQQWGKRIQLLYVVTRIVRAYKEKRRTFLASDSQDKLDQRLYKAYKLKENLLNFISNDQLVGMKPAQWWTRRFDIDLILGTHKWGYGNYQVMREDQKLSYCKNPKNDPYYQFPQAEQVTKRLKKLVQLISRVEGEFDFDGQIKLSEHSGFNLEEKNAIVEVVCDIGIPIGSDETKKSDFQHIRNRASMILNRIMTQPDHKIEKFLNFIQSECQKLTTEYSGHLQRIGYKDLNKELNDYKVLKPKQLRLDLFENQGQELYFKTDDEDDFRVTIDIAFKINKRVALFNLIRKIIMSNQNQLFDACIDDLTELIIEEREKDECYLPVDWLVGIHDRGLLNAISERGVSYLKQAKQEHEFGLYAITISSKKLLRRVEFLCHYFKTLPQRGQILNPERQSAIKASMLSIQNKPTQKIKINIDSDANGNIKYPIEINQSLKILNLGYIDNERQNYHSHRNLFPIGFKTIRTHQSLFNLGARAEYICEILDGGERPLFKVTPAEEPDKPIIKDSTSGCWLEIVKRIESMTNIRKGKVTVSGPDRYGLQEPAVMQLIQQLPNADKCQRYQFR
eukprot:403345198